MKKIGFLAMLLVAVAVLIVVSCKKDKKSGSPCSGFFTNNHPTDNFTAISVGGSTFSTYFTKDQSYKVTVENNGNINIATKTSAITFNGGTDITECKDEGHEYNVFYENKTSGIKLIFQKDGSNYILALRKTVDNSDFATLKR